MNKIKHTAKECRQNIDIVTPLHAVCRICGAVYKRSKNWGKSGWQKLITQTTK